MDEITEDTRSSMEIARQIVAYLFENKEDVELARTVGSFRLVVTQDIAKIIDGKE